MTYRVYALLEQVQASHLQPMLNRVLSHSQCQELGATDHPVLPLRYPGYCLIPSASSASPRAAAI